MNRCKRLAWIVAILGIVQGGPAAAGPPGASFGDTLTQDTKLTADLSGAGTGLIIGASGITVDLNGYTLSMTAGAGWGIDNTGGYDNVTVKNGRIEGFDEGVRAIGADGLRLEQLEVDGANGSSATTGAIHVFGGEDVRIRNCSISVTPVFLGPHAIRLDSVEQVQVQDCEIDGGFTGVAFFSVDGVIGLGDPTTGSIRGCTMVDCYSSGVLLANTDDAHVADNSISGAGAGMQIGIHAGIPPRNIQVSGNTIQDCAVGGLDVRWLKDSVISDNEVGGNAFFGVLLRLECTGNRISGNLITENGFRGLVVNFGGNDNRITGNEVTDNGLEGITLFQGVNTGNLIADNVATGNGVFDLFHNAASTPNLWQDNDYDTASGADID